MKHLIPKVAASASKEEEASPLLCLQSWMDRDYAKLWRLLRALGVSDYDLEDAIQEVFWTSFQKRAVIVSGSEWAYLAGVARGYASNYRKRIALASQSISSSDECDRVASSESDPEQACQEKQEEACIHEAISSLPEELREVFVLLAIEEMSQYEVAELLQLPRTTVASKWKKAHDMFELMAKKLLDNSKVSVHVSLSELEADPKNLSLRSMKGGAHE